MLTRLKARGGELASAFDRRKTISDVEFVVVGVFNTDGATAERVGGWRGFGPDGFLVVWESRS